MTIRIVAETQEELDDLLEAERNGWKRLHLALLMHGVSVGRYAEAVSHGGFGSEEDGANVVPHEADPGWVRAVAESADVYGPPPEDGTE